MWMVVAGIGFPAAIRFEFRLPMVFVRNRTALALCLSWLIGEATWLVTENNLPLKLYFVLDYAVLLVILTKEGYDCFPYRTFWDQLKALWLERCEGDGLIAAIFPVMWFIYIADMDDFYRWWTLWGLVLVQFFAAGWGALHPWLKQRREAIQEQGPPGTLRVGLVNYG